MRLACPLLCRTVPRESPIRRYGPPYGSISKSMDWVAVLNLLWASLSVTITCSTYSPGVMSRPSDMTPDAVRRCGSDAPQDYGLAAWKTAHGIHRSEETTSELQ